NWVDVQVVPVVWKSCTGIVDGVPLDLEHVIPCGRVRTGSAEASDGQSGRQDRNYLSELRNPSHLRFPLSSESAPGSTWSIRMIDRWRSIATGATDGAD